ncbi:MAG: PH domain-containing protein [candidate division KSB1 bacterium]|nr:PH domain-containing protein [candidate division KSB1 bacterium]MDZ7275841.1 PH domain-containing protein [candidate division KSB1 bacterium]MDZ7287591.1 PH domain-containing protein [candidate division KSB1 bacterium]MDZ7306505.1 PH domain-containing protein [candidate division KSB1 bacterium]MDZ7350569.1 PH domain-containing protein [candidate division KSB1 bacterium]
MIYRTRPAWRRQWGLMFLALFFVAGMLAVLYESYVTPDSRNPAASLSLFAVPLLLLCLIMVFRHYAWRFTVEDGTIESRHGYIAREIKSVRVEDVRNINVTQTFIQRLLGIGNIEFSSSGTSGIEVIFENVADPVSVKNKIMKMM